ncbi:MAG: hypothetical protein ACYDAD_10675 [Acidimicrobiales bacterium]
MLLPSLAAIGPSVVAARAAVGGGTAAVSSGATSSPDKVVYVVVPHPDDEFEAWSLLQRTPSTLKVFILLTHGERTSACDRPHADEPGELPPAAPPGGTGSASCAQDRLISWNAALDAQADIDSSFDQPGPASAATSPLPSGDCPIPDAGESIAFGRLTARIVFDLGDGRVRPCQVSWAVQSARMLVDDFASGLTESGAIGAAYHATDRHCLVNLNRDHAAVFEALTQLDLGVGPQHSATCGRTWRGTTRRTTVAPDVWTANMAVGLRSPYDRRGYTAVGNLQRQYGWLFPANLDFDDQTGHDLTGGPHSEFQRRQTFAVLNPPGG